MSFGYNQYLIIYIRNTLGSETFANFMNFGPIRESKIHEKFYIDQFVKVYAHDIFPKFLNLL